ncbi:reticulon-4-interacting protein, partial [Dactylonectria estremocensis]
SRALTQFPKTPGTDFSGRVVAVAEDFDDLKPGDAVLGRVLAGRRGGTLGEFVVVRRDACAAMPEGMGWDEAAGAPTAMEEPPRVFINGGSGGVGLFRIQVAKAPGCRVTASCSTVKAALCRSAGADAVIDAPAVQGRLKATPGRGNCR